ncbi:MAG TPA: CBS domain-containing protein [Oscillatoriales cyanobacterium M59_W2019_021]|nr:MAG: CBS domain-containing protein [Cyanobacteria bacterium J055]HIK29789.1 CBS domain-containing protein [Oscillatoriales cyanobacterium M4454_W2019_049]HIK49835.1 CBS domain-containing protein [Oscillatoriales cyanobacterium M59_W2019_021]
MSDFPSSDLLQNAIDPQPLTVKPSASVAEAIARMSQHRSSYIAIVEGETLIGIFTERDVVRLTSQAADLATLPVERVMSSQLVTISEAQSPDLVAVLSRMRAAKIRHLPIIDDGGTLRGIVTAQNLRQALTPTDLLQMRYVADVMVTDVVKAAPTDSLLSVAQQMATHRKSCIIICTPSAAGNQCPLGILTERDIVRFQVRGLDFNATLAAEAMSTPLWLLQPDATLWEAHQLMQRHNIRRLVVADDAGILAGIVTQSTLLAAIDPADLNVRIEWLQQVISEKTQALSHANAQMQREMAQRIEAEAQVRRLNADLEVRVRERTAQLEASNRELQNTLQRLQTAQDELIQAEKMVALGQLIGGVAHEINTPLAAIRSSASNLSGFLTQILQELPNFFQKFPFEGYADFCKLLERSNSSLSLLSTREKRQARRQLIEQLESENIVNADRVAETLVELGLYDDLASWLPLLKKAESETILDAVYRISNMKKSLEVISIATERAAKVVLALKQYIYPHPAEKVKTNIIDGIETVLTLYQSQFKQGVEIVRNYDPLLPEIFCYPDELQQVWMNLIQNALHAMKNQGIISIDVRHQDDSILVGLTDTGSGISQEILPLIFDMFYTTKKIGEGSGMGLYLVQKIIDKHSGEIRVESEPGRTEFTIVLPIET